ncbi:MAG TPA: tetratricopeptide repeat protein [Candidatus Obscuribacterales bacterium]
MDLATSKTLMSQTALKVPTAKHRRIWRHVVSIVIALLLIAPSWAKAVPTRSYEIESKVYRLCCDGQSMLASRNYAGACDVLLQAAAYDPTSYSPNVHLNLAYCYHGLKINDQAISHAQQALKYRPDWDDALHLLALIYYGMNEFDKANSYLQRFNAVCRDASSRNEGQKLMRQISAYKNVQKAEACLNAGQMAQAQGYLEKAAAYDPSPFSKYVHANLCYVLRRDNPQRAVEEGKKALSFDPQDKNTVYNIGLAYETLGQFDDAISWVQRYINMEIDPAQRERAVSCLKGFTEDRNQQRDPGNKLPDYFEQMKSDGEALTWPRERLPLKVCVMSGKGVVGYRPTFDKCVIMAMDTWCEASGKKIAYALVNDPQKADITVAWTSNPLKITLSHENALPAGLTHVRGNRSSGIDRADISIRTVHPCDPARTVKQGECAALCMHEVGHALGLNHSKLISDVMYFRSSPRQSGRPTRRDRATIAKLYADYPATNFVPRKESQDPREEVLPPPAFLPPKPADAKKLTPPMFLPPPPKSEDEKLQPPLFMPPKPRRSEKAPPIPTFLPKLAPGAQKKGPTPPMFVPPRPD